MFATRLMPLYWLPRLVVPTMPLEPKLFSKYFNSISLVSLNASRPLSVTTFAAPTNVVLGQGGSVVISRGTAAYSAAWNSFYKWPSAFGTGTLTTATGSVDMMVYHVYSTSAAACQMINNLA